MSKSKLNVASPVVKSSVKAGTIKAGAKKEVLKNDLFERYLELKHQEETLKKEMNEIKLGFEQLQMNGFEMDGKILKLQERNTISYMDEMKKYLEYKGVLDKCTTIEKSKVEALLKVDILDKTEVEKFKMVNKTTAWTVSIVK